MRSIQKANPLRSYFARQAIDKADECLLVEGIPMSSLFTRQELKNAVASAEHHSQQIS